MAKRGKLKRLARSKKVRIGAAIIGGLAAAGAVIGLRRLAKKRRTVNVRIKSVRRKR